MTIYARLAAAGTYVVQKGGASAQTKISKLNFTATAQSTVTFTDGTNSFVVDIMPGVNEFCKELIFKPGEDVTLTAAGGTVSIFGEVNQK